MVMMSRSQDVDREDLYINTPYIHTAIEGERGRTGGIRM